MSISSISSRSRVTPVRRPMIDVAVERLARRLLRWSERRAALTQPPHERMTLIVHNERTRPAGGSTVGR
ncbi:MAG: hypothetical protein WDM88_05120 [Galbitalea sp.]